MNAELIRMRKNKNLNIQVDDAKAINTKSLLERIYSLNMKKNELSDISYDPNSTIDDYAKKIAETIYIILDMFSDMDIYPDYFYDICFRTNEDYRDAVSKGRVNGRGNLNDVPFYQEQMSYNIERGINANNHRLNPMQVKNIDKYYHEMVEFLHKYYLPCEVTTVEMCRDMFYDIVTECGNCINGLGIKSYLPYDVEKLARLLFEYIRFYAAVGVNPKEYLDAEILKHEEKGKSR